MNIPINPAETAALGQPPKDVQHYMRAGTLGLPALPVGLALMAGGDGW